MLGSRRCGPSMERRRGRCSVYQLSPLRILEELATECAASQLRGRAASRTPLKAFVELHNRGSYTAALEVAERSLRPAGWRVVTAVLLREARALGFNVKLLRALCVIYSSRRIALSNRTASKPFEVGGTIAAGCSCATGVAKVLLLQLDYVRG